MNNPMQALIAFAKSGGNPMQMIQQMAQNNPQARAAMQLMQGKNPQQLRETAENMAKERGTTIEQAMRMLGL